MIPKSLCETFARLGKRPIPVGHPQPRPLIVCARWSVTARLHWKSKHKQAELDAGQPQSIPQVSLPRQERFAPAAHFPDYQPSAKAVCGVRLRWLGRGRDATHSAPRARTLRIRVCAL